MQVTGPLRGGLRDRDAELGQQDLEVVQLAEHVLEPLEELDQRTRPGGALVGDRLEQVAQPLHSDARGVNGVLIARGAGGLELLLEHDGLLA